MPLTSRKNRLGLLLLLEVMVGSAFAIGALNVSSAGHEQARSKACFASQRVLEAALDIWKYDRPASFSLPAGPFSPATEEDLLRMGYLEHPTLGSLPSPECAFHVAQNAPADSRPPLYCADHGNSDLDLERGSPDCPAYVPPARRPWRLWKPGDASGLVVALGLLLPIGFLYHRVHGRLPWTYHLRIGLCLLMAMTIGGRAGPFFVGLLFLGATAMALLGLLWEAFSLMRAGPEPPER
ncbi:MAG: hypothetical protein GX442_15240 [Candidatus Riflebacteria bacterium]|nr:hypothetical protein [Candidatus Riflebacteria bacterium]